MHLADRRTTRGDTRRLEHHACSVTTTRRSCCACRVRMRLEGEGEGEGDGGGGGKAEAEAQRVQVRVGDEGWCLRRNPCTCRAAAVEVELRVPVGDGVACGLGEERRFAPTQLQHEWVLLSRETNQSLQRALVRLEPGP